MAKILIPTPLRQYTGKLSQVDAPGNTVAAVLDALTAQHADLRKHLYNDAGALRSYVNIYVNDEDIRYLQKSETPVTDADTLTIVPSIAGGSATLTEPIAGEAPNPSDDLTNEEILRYSRHLIMPEVGKEGQLKLKNAKVLLVGAGGLGAPLGLYLAAAGIGRIGLVDFDVVDHTNLHRQVIHGTKDVGRKKLDSAADRMRDINPNVRLDLHEIALTSENAFAVMEPYDIIVDGTDNFPTRYLVNDACVLLGKPNVYGSIFRFEGQATVFAYPGGPCYRCSYPEPPPPGLVPSCAEGGVLGILPGMIGVIQATETVKLILGIGEPLIGRLLRYDALEMRFREYKVRRDPHCPVCGDSPTVTRLIDYQQFCGIPQQVTHTEPAKGEIDVTEVKQKIDRGADFVLVDVREPHEYQIASIPQAKLIPLGELGRRLGELDPDDEIVVHCKSGGRSAKAVEFLRQQGFKDVSNMRGGILAWSDKVDPKVPKY
ncbi:molybdopterin-synthase adenylyltransferase MoeB [Nevskia soli]|jgi:adenylyltransferase/sulfurtransferase|uniref:molybdopterin-synthase adenylyltransferase MoeB n=1 Tax=Nevskia soli TaxID=418856 RepID=UPI0015D88ED4|nr:molybdopterin-synthase adenylyltransferase MoeB [Nevskia soli]